MDNQKSYVIAALLCLFLGGLGAHRFYLGKNQSAIILLSITILACWVDVFILISFLWVLIDLIMICIYSFKVNDSLGEKNKIIRVCPRCKNVIDENLKVCKVCGCELTGIYAGITNQKVPHNVSTHKDEDFIKEFVQSPTNNEEYNSFLQLKKPDILNFLSKEDYHYVIFLYTIRRNVKDYKFPKNLLEKDYRYSQYDWKICMDIFQRYLLFKTYTEKDLTKMEENNIKKVKLICNEECDCCRSMLNKSFPIAQVKELPMAVCPLEVPLCKGATYVVDLSYDD